MRNLKMFLSVLALSVAFGAAGLARADDLPTYEIVLKGTTFTPKEVKAKAGQSFRLKLTNGNAAPAELESSSLGFEKTVAGSSSIVVNVRPQKPGKYKFYDDFHEHDAIGYVDVE